MSEPTVLERIAELFEEARQHPERRPAIYDKLDDIIFGEVFRDMITPEEIQDARAWINAGRKEDDPGPLRMRRRYAICQRRSRDGDALREELGAALRSNP
jgi:hypothetical protein